MTLKTNYKFLFIGDDENIFVKNYSCNLAAKEKEKGSQLFITIEIRNNLSNAKIIGEKIFNDMRRYLSDNLNEESYKRFKNSLKEINKVLNELHINDLSALIGFIAGKDLYLTQTGDAAAYLARNNSIEVISQGLSEKKGDTFTSIAKGKVEAGDFVIFSSVSLFQYISRVELAKVLDAGILADSLSKLNKLISTKISGHVGIIGITFEKASKLIKETVAVTTLASKPICLGPIGRGWSFIKKLPHKLLAKILKIKIPKIKIPEIKIPKIKIPKIEIKIPKFLSNIADSIKNLLLSVRHRIGMTFKKISELIKEAVAVTKKLSHKLLGIFAVVIVVIIIFVFGIIWHAKNSVPTKILESGYHGEATKEILALVQQARDNIDNVRRVENPKVFVDFSAKQPNINPIGFLALKDKFFTFEHNKLYGISLDKIEELATFKNSETIVSATDFENQDSLIFTTKSGKLIQYKNGNVTFVETTDGEFKNGIAINDWGDRIYILDPDKNQIWRYSYSPSYDIFGSAKGYNADSELKDVVGFAIDGFIYILHKNGSIDKLYKSLKQDFSIQNKSLTKVDTPSKIYTGDGLNQIFVMDSGTSRIFIYAKDLKTGNAVYNSQIVFPTISDLRDLYVDKNANKLYLLDAQKVYEIGL